MNSAPSAPLRPRRTGRRAAGGLSLVELLVAVAIAAVLLGVAAPSVAAIVHSSRLTAATQIFLAGLHLARSEAVRRGGHVLMCKSADGLACATTGGWDQGWIIFHDRDGDGIVGAGEQLIQRTEALDAGVSLTGNQAVARAIAFNPAGRSRTMAGGMLAGTLTVCNKADAAGPGRQIVLASGGRIRVQQLAHCAA